MASIINVLQNFHKQLYRHADPRTANRFLISSPFYPVVLGLTYIYIVKFLGPRLMENKKPFVLKRILIIYNLYQVLLNAWLFYEFAVTGWFRRDWSYKCQPIDHTDNPRAVRMANACFWFYISKYIDFLDTIFFILRKKDSQITKLHIIHHTTVPLSAWAGVAFAPGGHGTFCGFLNTFVHVIMYSYYGLAALGPKVQKYLWWKNYITKIQIIQFIAFMIHSSQIFLFDCDFPRIPISIVMFNGILFLYLFSDFYKKTYNKKADIIKSQSLTKNGLANNGFIRINKLKTG